jgi:hypothetical protein
MRLLILLLVCLFGVSTLSVAQSSKKKKKKNETTNVQQPSSVEPYYPKQNYEPKQKKSSGKITYDARDRFYDRMEQVAKAHRKAEKELAKPQYSDPTYFGHKKPPKRRPPHKMKYCKECGIRH